MGGKGGLVAGDGGGFRVGDGELGAGDVEGSEGVVIGFDGVGEVGVGGVVGSDGAPAVPAPEAWTDVDTFEQAATRAMTAASATRPFRFSAI